MREGEGGRKEMNVEIAINNYNHGNYNHKCQYN